MSIVPASRLSASDLALLGNNLAPARPPKPRVPRRDLAAVNRSLAGHGERVDRLYRTHPPGGVGREAACPL